MDGLDRGLKCFFEKHYTYISLNVKLVEIDLLLK